MFVLWDLCVLVLQDLCVLVLHYLGIFVLDESVINVYIKHTNEPLNFSTLFTKLTNLILPHPILVLEAEHS